MAKSNGSQNSGMTRRDLLKLIGQTAGGVAMYNAMTSLGFASESNYSALDLKGGAPKGASVLILGAGIAGMTAAYELRKAGYKVTVVEYQDRAGGRCWTLRGGDVYTELGGAKQKCEFEKGDYFNPGPWRIPFHHHGVLDYCRKFNVELQPFIQNNYNAYFHDPDSFGGKPVRHRHVTSDIQGNVAELLAKAVQNDLLDAPVTKEDKQKLLEDLRSWGALTRDFKYTKGNTSSDRRGYEVDAGGGLMPLPVPSEPLNFQDLVRSDVWGYLEFDYLYEYQQSIFQPIGGMDMIAKGFEKQVKDLIKYNTKVTKIAQDDKGVTVSCLDLKTKKPVEYKADWCICTIPPCILSQMEVQVSSAMKAAIDAVPQETGFKAAIQFKRRFWEEDDRIYGGLTYTSTPLRLISYPIHKINHPGKGVVVAAYMFGADSYKFSSLPPAERLGKVMEFGTMIHPQFPKEFDNGISVGWHRVPWAHGCHGIWTNARREQYYDTLCQIDGRLMLAGEHASRIPAWIEGAVLSAVDAVSRLHKRVLS